MWRRRSAPASSPPTSIDPRVIFGALMGAIVWNVITWALGIPSSSSHALIGGLVGAGIAKAGVSRHRLDRPEQDQRRDRALAADRLLAGAAADADRVVAVRALHAVRGRPHVPHRCSSSRPRSIRSATAATTRRRPWASSRCCCTRRASWRRVPRAVLGGDHLPGRDGAGHAVRRLAHRADDGLEDHAAHADAGLLRRDRRRDHAVRRDLARHSGLDHAHHHRLHHRRRRGAAGLRGALERGRTTSWSPGSSRSRLRPYRRAVLCLAGLFG